MPSLSDYTSKEKAAIYAFIYVLPGLTVLAFLISLGVVAANDQTALTWGPAMYQCSCKPAELISIQLSPSFVSCITRVNPQYKPQGSVEFTRDLASLQFSLGEKIYNASVPLQSDCGVPIDTVEFPDGGFVVNNNTITNWSVPLDGIASQCRKIDSFGAIRDLVLYDRVPKDGDPSDDDVRGPWNHFIRLETNRYMLGVSVINTTAGYANLASGLDFCSRWLDERVWTHQCKCPLDIIGNAVSIASIVLLAIIPIRYLLHRHVMNIVKTRKQHQEALGVKVNDAEDPVMSSFVLRNPNLGGL